MSDHVDGPRQIGDPSADLSDLFAFTSPENAARTVVAANAFPSGGVTAMFSNVVEYSIVLRRATLSGTGETSQFVTAGDEIRFKCKFDPLLPAAGGARPVQHGTCTCPDGQVLKLTLNDEKGAASADGTYRVFAGLRSDPFYLAWLVAELKKFPNLLQHDNVLSIVIDFDTERVLAPAKGALFGVIAETVPIPQPGGFIGHPPPRIDWVGRPEQTNMRLNNPAMAGTEDLRDLWNQQTPFAIDNDLKALFRQRLVDSLNNWDMRDGKADWTPSAIFAAANMYLDDFMLIDVSKPTNDTSYFEIEKSTLRGKAYQTGGGRTVNANVIDIMLTWMVNNDREFLQGGATQATKPGTAIFPYLASPNHELQVVTDSVDLAAAPAKVWAAIGAFGSMWNPLVARITTSGSGTGELRAVELVDGKAFVERLEAMDNAKHSYKYGLVSGIPAVDFAGTLSVVAKGTGSTVQWRIQFMADGQPTILLHTVFTEYLHAGLGALKKRFDASP